MILFVILLSAFVIVAISFDLFASCSYTPEPHLIQQFDEKAEIRLKRFKEKFRTGNVAKHFSGMDEAEAVHHVQLKMLEYNAKSGPHFFCMATGLMICLPAGYNIGDRSTVLLFLIPGLILVIWGLARYLLLRARLMSQGLSAYLHTRPYDYSD